MVINQEMKMAEVVHLNYTLIPTLHRFGIKLGFGDKSVAEICKEQGINVDFFIELVNAFSNKDYQPSQKIETLEINPLVDYLKKTHRFYLDEKVIEIQEMIEQLRKTEKKDQKYVDLILNFFNGYKNELVEHIEREERVVFPYVYTLNKVLAQQKIAEEDRHIIENYSMEVFEEEHDDISVKLKDLKNIMIKYLICPENSSLYYNIIKELFQLEEDINYHTRIEDKVLIPRVIFIEERIQKLL